MARYYIDGGSAVYQWEVEADSYDFADGYFTFDDEKGESVFSVKADYVVTIRRKPTS